MIRYRLFMPKADSFSYIEFKTEADARHARNLMWKEPGCGPVAVQFKNDRYPQDGWRDVPFYQEGQLA